MNNFFFLLFFKNLQIKKHHLKLSGVFMFIDVKSLFVSITRLGLLHVMRFLQ